MKLKSVMITLGVIGFCGLGWFGITTARSKWITPGHVGVIFNANSGLESKVYKPQRIVPGLRESVYQYPTRMQAAIYSQDTDLAEARAADGIQITTSDNATTTFDVIVFYRVRPENVFQVFKTFGAINIGDIQRLHIRRAVKEAVNVAGTQYDVFQIMGEKRKEASELATRDVRRILESKGITVHSVILGAAYPNENVKQKIIQRVNAYTELQISQLKNQIAEIDRQIAVTEANAEMEAQKLTAATASGTSLVLLKMQADAAAIEKWDGRLPRISPRQGQTVIVDQNMIKQLGGGQ